MKKLTVVLAALLALSPLSTAFATPSDCDSCKESIEFDKTAQQKIRMSALTIEDRAWELRGRPGTTQLHNYISITESLASNLRESARLVEEDTARKDVPELGAIWMKGKEPDRGDVKYFLSVLKDECKLIDDEVSQQRLSHKPANVRQTLATIKVKAAALQKLLPALQRDCADPTKSCRETLQNNGQAKKVYFLAADMLVAETTLLSKTIDKSPSTPSSSSTSLDANTKAALAAIEDSSIAIYEMHIQDRLPLTASASMTKSWNCLRENSALLLGELSDIRGECAKTNACKESVKAHALSLYRKAAALLAANRKLQGEIDKLSYVE